MPFNTAAHASDVVCVSIGLNLLFPFVPKVAQVLLADIVTDPKEIVKRRFLNPETVSEDDLRRIGELAKKINRARTACVNRPSASIGLRTMYVLTALGGIFLLWSGYVDDLKGWCAFLLAPPAVVVFISSLPCLYRRIQFSNRIKAARKNAKRKCELDAERDEINEFVQQMTSVSEESSAS